MLVFGKLANMSSQGNSDPDLVTCEVLGKLFNASKP